METVLGGLACIAVAVATFVMGIMWVDGTGPRLFRRREADAPSTRQQLTTGPAFKPLDLAPAALLWPSEQPSAPRRLPDLPWPSETWTDNFFERKPGAFAEPRTETASEPSKPQRPKSRGSSKPARKAELTRPQAVPTADAHPERPTKPHMTPERVAAIVEERGLAGAVEWIRAETGWDFQEAAQYLARVMRQIREGRS